jgi:hypothetical protein
MRPLQPSKHGGQLGFGAERDDDPAAITQSLNSKECRHVMQKALPVFGYSHSLISRSESVI